MDRTRLLLLVLLGCAAWYYHGQSRPDCPDGKCPAPKAPSPPLAPPIPQPKPRKPWGTGGAPVGAKVAGPRLDDGTEAHCDLPASEHLKNKGGRDGAGLCVFTSIDHSARWQNESALIGFRDWMTKHPGGGWPAKVDTMIQRICTERGLLVPDYLQVEHGDLTILKQACQSGRMPGVTYSRSPTGRYGGARIAHMVSLVHACDKWFAVLDNNYPGSLEWMSPEEFKRTYSGGGGGWAVILLRPGPPPPPKNRS